MHAQQTSIYDSSGLASGNVANVVQEHSRRVICMRNANNATLSCARSMRLRMPELPFGHHSAALVCPLFPGSTNMCGDVYSVKRQPDCLELVHSRIRASFCSVNPACGLVHLISVHTACIRSRFLHMTYVMNVRYLLPMPVRQ